jgi:hypothetical protein
MPTTFGMILLSLLLVGTVVGVVLWARDASRRGGSAPTRSKNGAVPYDEDRAAAEQARTADRHGRV